jgi:hypothetical protein
MTSMDREDPAHEIGSNGRVRGFVRHVCGDLSDVYPFLHTEQNAVFCLPKWFDAKWNIKASLAKLSWRPPGREPYTPAIDESSTLSIEETEEFVLGEEEIVIMKLRAAIARAHRIALVKLGKTGFATAGPQKEMIAATHSEVHVSSRPARKEKVVFVRRNGETVVQGEPSRVAIANTFAALAETLRQLRAWVPTQKNGRVSVQEAKTRFRGTELNQAADDTDWKDWIEIFGQKSSVRPKGVAVGFLAKKLGLELGTIEKYCSIGRKTVGE